MKNLFEASCLLLVFILTGTSATENTSTINDVMTLTTESSLDLDRAKMACDFVCMSAIQNPARAASLLDRQAPTQLAQAISTMNIRAVTAVTKVMNHTQIMRVMNSLTPDQIMALTARMSVEQIETLLSRLPASGVVKTSQRLNATQLSQFLVALPPQGLVNLTLRLNTTQNGAILSKLPKQGLVDLVDSLLNVSAVSEVVSHLPLVDIAKQLPGVKLAEVMRSLSSNQLVSLVLDIPIMTLAPIMLKLPKEFPLQMLGLLEPPDLIRLARGLPSFMVTMLFNALKTEDMVLLLQKMAANDSLALLQELPPSVLDVLVSKLEPALTSLQPQLIVQMLGALSQNTTARVLGLLGNATLVNLTETLSPPQLVTLLSSVSSDTVGSLLSRLPVNAVLDKLAEASAEDLSQLLQAVPPGYVSSLVSLLPVKALVNLTLTWPAENLGIVLVSLNSSQLTGLLAQVPESVTTGLVTALPPALLVNVTRLLPAPELFRILGKLNASTTVSLLAAFPAQALSSLVDTLQQQPEAFLNLTMQLPAQALTTILTTLPPQRVAQLVQSFPQQALNDLVPKLPVDVVLGLTKVLPGDFITRMPLGVLLQVVTKIPAQDLARLIKVLIPKGPLSLLSSLPPNLVSGLLDSVTPEQIQMLLAAFPPDKLQGLVRGMLPGLVTSLTQGGDLGAVLQPVVKTLVQSLQKMDPAAKGRLFASLGPVLNSVLPVLKDALPALLGALTSGAGGGALPGLVSSLVESVPVSSLVSLLGPMLPEIPRQLARSLGQLGASVGGSDEEMLQCLQDSQTYLMDLANGSHWAVSMFDASGKPGRGLLKGNTHLHGNYDQCVDVSHWLTATTDVKAREIKGRYCGAEIQLPPGVLPPVPGKGILPDIVLELYLCLPNTCDGRILSNLTASVQLPLNISISAAKCQEPLILSEDTTAIGAICVLAFLIFIVALGTILDVAQHSRTSSGSSSSGSDLGPWSAKTNAGFEIPDPGETYESVEVGKGEKQTSFIKAKNGSGLEASLPAPGVIEARPAAAAAAEDVQLARDDDDEGRSPATRVLLAFSLRRCTHQVLGLCDVRDSVTCLHGVRVLSLCWVVVGHSFLFMAKHFENSLGAAEALETLLGQVVIHSTLAVDSFLLVSGCLTCLLCLRKVRDQGGLRAKSMLTYFLHRYLRLTPAYAVVIMTLTCLLPYISDGPNWTLQSQEYFHSCRKYWWTSLLYVSNFYKSLEQQCVPWGWYLSVDVQLHWIVAPFIIIPFAFSRRVFPCLLIGGLVLLQMIMTIYLQSKVNGDYLRNKEEFWWRIFEKPYTRVAPFALGLGLGYCLHRLNRRLYISRVTVMLGWVVALAACFAAVLAKYDENHVMLKDPFHWPETARSAHEGVYRVVFSLGLYWVILMCHTGHGGFVNSVLSWKVFLPLSHLTFCMYLLHPAVILADIWQTRVPPYFTVDFVLQRATGYIIISAILAYFLSVTVEQPIRTLEKLAGKKRRASFSDTPL